LTVGIVGVVVRRSPINVGIVLVNILIAALKEVPVNVPAIHMIADISQSPAVKVIEVIVFAVAFDNATALLLSTKLEIYSPTTPAPAASFVGVPKIVFGPDAIRDPGYRYTSSYHCSSGT